jgi:PD-(D/E)XK nuclease superfamily
VRRQVPIPIKYKNLEFDEGFRADLIVENMVLLELKASETNHAVYYRQLASYLKLSDPAEPAEPADPAVPFTTSACGTNQKGKTSPGYAVLATNLV